jgi:hypothetical protein
MTSKTDAAVTTHHELGILPKLVSLPREPMSAKWEVDERPGKASKLRALLRYSPDDYEHILEHSEVFDRRDNELLSPDDYEWIDAAAREGVESRPKGRWIELVGVEPRKGTLFGRAPRSPYVNGKITPLPNGYIFVLMSAT